MKDITPLGNRSRFPTRIHLVFSLHDLTELLKNAWYTVDIIVQKSSTKNDQIKIDLKKKSQQVSFQAVGY